MNGTMSVIATIASNIAMSTCWPRPVPLALAQRRERSDQRVQRARVVA
jgi:hypothetical protein